MVNVICVNPDKLDIYVADISKSSAMLNNISRTNKELISNAQQKIDNAIRNLEHKKINAQIELENAENALRFARATADKDEEPDFSYYYRQIGEARKKLTEISEAINEANVLEKDYMYTTAQYSNIEYNFINEYNNLLKNGCSGIKKYTELVRFSVEIISTGQ
jgi:hypothetical protein